MVVKGVLSWCLRGNDRSGAKIGKSQSEQMLSALVEGGRSIWLFNEYTP